MNGAKEPSETIWERRLVFSNPSNDLLIIVFQENFDGKFPLDLN
jgi:hypothetical protein